MIPVDRRYRQALALTALIYAVGYAMGHASGRVSTARELLRAHAEPRPSHP